MATHSGASGTGSSGVSLLSGDHVDDLTAFSLSKQFVLRHMSNSDDVITKSPPHVPSVP